MTQLQALASFAQQARFQDLSKQALEQLKIRVLDTIGVAIGALDAEIIGAIRKLTAEAVSLFRLSSAAARPHQIARPSLMVP